MGALCERPSGCGPWPAWASSSPISCEPSVSSRNLNLHVASEGREAKEASVTQVLVAPLGELPNEKALRDFGRWVLKADRECETGTLLPRNSGEGAVRRLLHSLLKEVRAAEGVWTSQTNGRIIGSCLEASVLAVAGVHANRSIYVLHWERAFIEWKGKPIDLTLFLRANLEAFPEVRMELEALNRILRQRYPALENALKGAPEDLEKRLSFVTAIERGHVVFLSNLKGRVTHALVGSALIPIRPTCEPYRQGEIQRASESKLVRVLQQTPLKAIPSEALLALLRGEADGSVVREAERVWALARLAEL